MGPFTNTLYVLPGLVLWNPVGVQRVSVWYRVTRLMAAYGISLLFHIPSCLLDVALCDVY